MSSRDESARKRWLEDLKMDNLPDQDDLDQHAREGYAYLKDDPDQVLQRLDQRMDTLLARPVQKNPGARTMRMTPFLWRMAAGILLLLIPTYFLLLNPRTSSHLFDKYFEVPQSNYFQAMRGDLGQDQALNEAFAAYEAGNYAVALIKIEALMPDREHPDLPFYAGVCQLAIGNTQEAILHLDKVRTVTYNNTDVKALWYLGLCYLKQGQIKEAVEALQQITSGDGTYTALAKELLEEIEG